jgi:hypothetical protein
LPATFSKKRRTSALEATTARIREYDAQIEKLAERSCPDLALLKQGRV